jgi:phosphoribosyl 1,2-cyclic phosphodiesterase
LLVRFAVLGSGSKGNALVIQGGGKTLLIDCGYGPREIKRRLAFLDVDITAIDALFITHGHGDHTKGAKQLAGSLGIETYATLETKRFCAGFGGLKNHVPISSPNELRLGGLTVRPQATPHDAPGSVCFVIEDGDHAFGICTDLGGPALPVARALSGCDSLVLESNHDKEMLRTGPYTTSLKRRIAGPRGHLSNDQGATLLEMIVRGSPGRLTRVLLAHLSEVNNTPALALAAARPVIDGKDVELTIAPQHHPTGWVKVRRTGSRPPVPVAVARAPARHAALARQLSLFSTRSA